MAKKSHEVVNLVSERDPKCGFRYTILRTTKGLKAGEKMRFRKYNPVIRQHEWFVEKKLPSHSANKELDLLLSLY